MAELVRVRTATGFETSVSRVVAQASEDLTILDDQPATSGQGVTLPVVRASGRRHTKPKTTVAKRAAAKKRTSRKPAARKATTPNPATSTGADSTAVTAPADNTKENDQ